MSDIVERLRTHCIDLEGGIRDEEILAAAGEITRLRSLLKEAGEWRDISTAPKDGTHFIGGQWIIEDGEPLFEQEVIWWSPSWGFAGGGYVQKPTLWMPLPSPPARTQGE